jgi:ethanolamine ammonia-lyase small subunit
MDYCHATYSIYIQPVCEEDLATEYSESEALELINNMNNPKNTNFDEMKLLTAGRLCVGIVESRVTSRGAVGMHWERNRSWYLSKPPWYCSDLN